MYSTYYWKIFHLTWATFRWTLPPSPWRLPSRTAAWSALAKNRKILHLAMLCTCKKLSRWQIVFPTRKGQGRNGKLQMPHWLTGNAKGEGRGEVRCLATDKKTVRLWPDWTTYKQLYLPFFSPLSLRLSLSSEINWKIIVFVFVTLEFSPCRKTFIRCLQFLPIFRLPFWKLLKGVVTTSRGH